MSKTYKDAVGGHSRRPDFGSRRSEGWAPPGKTTKHVTHKKEREQGKKEAQQEE